MATSVDRPARRLGAFVAALAVVFAAAFGVGRATADGPVADTPLHETHAGAER